MVLMFNPVKFIEEVKLRPGLYSPEVTVDRTEKIDLWKQVGAALFPDWHSLNKATAYDRALEVLKTNDSLKNYKQTNYKVDDLGTKSSHIIQLQKKWRSLRDTYKRELRARNTPNQPANRKVYRHFKRMSFLGGFDGVISPTEDSDDDEQLLYPLGGETSQNDCEEETDELETAPKKAKRKRRKRVSSPSLQPPEETEEYEIPTMPLFATDVQDDSDSDKYFLMSFVPEMRQLPVNIKMWARAQIANIMQEAVTSHFNNTMPRNENCVIIKNNLDTTES